MTTAARRRYKLRLKTLNFVSAVDRPAQETATAVLMKRDGAGDAFDFVERFAPVVKVSPELGLVFCWALTSRAGGREYWDLQGDNVLDDDLIKVAADFMERGGATDVMHDGKPDGSVVFAMPLTAEVARAFGVATQTTGLMVALRPSPETFARFKSGELTGVSIAGLGEREEVTGKAAAARAASSARVDRGLAHVTAAAGASEKAATSELRAYVSMRAAEMDMSYGAALAELTVNDPIARKLWQEHRGESAAIKGAPGDTAIVKTAADDVAKSESAYRAYVSSHAATLSKAAGRAVSWHSALLDLSNRRDSTWSALWSQLDAARTRHTSIAAKHAAAGVEDDLAAARADLDEQIEQFCYAANVAGNELTRAQASEKLLKFSRKARASYDRIAELTNTIERRRAR